MFEDNKLYLTDDPALQVLWPYSTLAHWRCEGRGPAFVKLGSKVAYKGADLNACIASRTVEPTEGQNAGA